MQSQTKTRKNERLKKKLGKKAVLFKHLKEVEKVVNRQQDDIKDLASATGENLALMEERSLVTYKLVHGLISYLYEDGLDNEILDFHIKKVTQKWKDEALDKRKEQLTEGQAICENCHYLADEDRFITDGDIACPKCKELGIYFAPEETDKTIAKEIINQ